MINLNKNVAVIEDDEDFSRTLTDLLDSVSLTVKSYSTAEDFLLDSPEKCACIISDIRLPGMSGLLLQLEVKKLALGIPMIFVSAYVDVPMTVQAMNNGALTVLTKPLRNQDLLDSVFNAITQFVSINEYAHDKSIYQEKIDELTSKEFEVLEWVVNGLPSKCIAHELDICKNTVDVHRANIMKKMSAKTLGDLIKNSLYFKMVDIKKYRPV